MPMTVGRSHYEHLRQTFRWNIIPWFRRFSSSRACCQWSRRVALSRSTVKSSRLWKKFRVFTLNTSIRSADDSEYTRTVDDIGEDFSGERCCFIEVQLPNTTEIHCPLITFSFNPQGSSWTVNRRQLPLRAGYATTFNGSQGLTLLPRHNCHAQRSVRWSCATIAYFIYTNLPPRPKVG